MNDATFDSSLDFPFSRRGPHPSSAISTTATRAFVSTGPTIYLKELESMTDTISTVAIDGHKRASVSIRPS